MGTPFILLYIVGLQDANTIIKGTIPTLQITLPFTVCLSEIDSFIIALTKKKKGGARMICAPPFQYLITMQGD